MKEAKLIEMRNKVESLGAALNKVIQELTNLRDLSKMLIFDQTFPFGLKMHIFNHQTFSNRNFPT